MLDEVVEVFVYAAVDPETKSDDWNAIAGLGIDKQRFLFERIALRAAAILLTLVDVSPANRSAIEEGFWRGLDKVNPNVGGAVQEYVQAFRNSGPKANNSRVFIEFSKRCSNGAEHRDLIDFARRTFLPLLTAYRQWLKSHGWWEI